MRRTLILLLLPVFFALVACDRETTVTTTDQLGVVTTTSLEVESPCKNDPFGTNCFIPSDNLDFISPVPDEYTISETFETEVVDQMPMNWLLYTNSEYKANGVFAKVKTTGDNKYVEMYSDGLQKPLYPQSAPTPTFIFTTKFNLDITQSGIANMDIMVPSENMNSVSAGVSTGAVNTISIIIDNDMSLLVKVGGPYYYYSQNGDGGDYHDTGRVLETETWYTFRFTWDGPSNLVAAYLVLAAEDVLLYEGPFHISNRFNAKADEKILVPNVVKITMPYRQSGYAYLDNVSVERSGEHD